MLIILGGLPGTGKTSVARAVAQILDAVHVRIDTIEQALLRARNNVGSNDAAGYVIGYAVAEDNLRLGHIVVANSVNPIAVTRDAWRGVAREASVRVLQVELICSDKIEHRRRVEARVADIPGHTMPRWSDVVARDYEPWAGDVLRLDTAMLSIDQCAERIAETSRGS